MPVFDHLCAEHILSSSTILYVVFVIFVVYHGHGWCLVALQLPILYVGYPNMSEQIKSLVQSLSYSQIDIRSAAVPSATDCGVQCCTFY